MIRLTCPLSERGIRVVRVRRGLLELNLRGRVRLKPAGRVQGKTGRCQHERRHRREYTLHADLSLSSRPAHPEPAFDHEVCKAIDVP